MIADRDRSHNIGAQTNDNDIQLTTTVSTDGGNGRPEVTDHGQVNNHHRTVTVDDEGTSVAELAKDTEISAVIDIKADKKVTEGDSSDGFRHNASCAEECGHCCLLTCTIQ